MNPRHAFVPPYLLQHLVDSGEPAVSEQAQRTLTTDRSFRAARGAMVAPTRQRTSAVAAQATVQRQISSANNTETLPGTPVRGEGDQPTGDAATDEAYDGFGSTWALFHDEYGRDSIDGNGMLLEGTVHYGQNYDNAFWDGQRMVFGDGDGEIFGRFTASLEVIGHELAHGVIERTAGLAYAGQSGALNEHVADAFGIMVKQRQLGQDAAASDWLVGADLLMPGVAGVAIRSMIEPGTAYDDPRLGKDPQPDHMDRFVQTTDDHGGVHINSGIPNRAFALAARAIGGNSWVSVGQVWYDTLTGGNLKPDADFTTFATLTAQAAATRFGEGSAEHNAVLQGWSQVGVAVQGAPRPEPGASPQPDPGTGSTEVPPSDAELLLRRTGGFAGTVRERRTTLEELPRKDAERWTSLLTSEALRSLGTTNPVADGFCYRVACEALEVDVTVPEQELSSSQRKLFQRTLNEE